LGCEDQLGIDQVDMAIYFINDLQKRKTKTNAIITAAIDILSTLKLESVADHQNILNKAILKLRKGLK